MDGLWFFLAGAGGLLSYEMPVYASRLLGMEDRLNQLWASGIDDALPAQILFIAFYMLCGFLLWAAPAALVASAMHPQTRGAYAPVLRALSAPFRPLLLLLLNGWDRAAGALAERKAIRAIYDQEFADEFASFARFKRYYRWVNAQDYIDPRAPLTSSSDSFKDAVAFLGLKDGFDQKALNARFGALMKQVHPDVAGPNDIARRLNEAREIIRARKGWT